ncbi:hypothetical protein FV242_19665 [Methylobacterium sp. WL64]|nr:hypothetical protein FVA80_24735 [Methylobacterium sp. WL1]TXN01084.1 hypothetical protein FV242_19665 [Methylobacterium sp. WL64]TXN55422.1 hypothetical protein FV241_20050 [Methylobacterium sp. WL2]
MAMLPDPRANFDTVYIPENSNHAAVNRTDTTYECSKMLSARSTAVCPSSDDLGHSAVFRSGGSGPSGVRG